MSVIFMEEQEYTTHEVARRLRVDRLTVIRKIEQGKIRARKQGQHWRIAHADLEAYIRSTYPQIDKGD